MPILYQRMAFWRGTGKRRHLEGSFEDLVKRASISNFRFHDLRHTFASWYMMNGGDSYELAKILGHANIKMTERYGKIGAPPHGPNRQHGTRTLEADEPRKRG